MGDMTLLIFLGLAMVGLLFMNSRGRKKQAQQAEFRNTLAPGQEVMTLSGQLGTVVGAVGDEVVIETTPGVRTRWLRQAVGPAPVSTAAVTDPTDLSDGPDAPPRIN